MAPPPVQQHHSSPANATSNGIANGHINGNSSWSTIPSSIVANRTVNPIRVALSRPVPPQRTSESTKPVLSLSLGDPTVFGNFDTHPETVKAVEKALHSFKFNGYPPATGYLQTRQAIAKKYSLQDSPPLTADDVVLTSGCSGAIEMVIGVLCNEGQNILIPRPGFSLYKTVAASKGVETRSYNLLAEKNWEVDLDHMASLIDSNTGAILINNPSNPCGSNFSKQHLQDIIALCESYKIPLISDEIYADMVFVGEKFYPAASLTKTVPVLTLGGLAKQWMVPGWRVGWVLVYDHQTGLLNDVCKGLGALATLINGPNSLIEAAIPDIFANVPESFLKETINSLQAHAELCAKLLKPIPGLNVIVPQGAMYMMVVLDIDRFEGIDDDVSFYQMLKWEEHVEVIPGQCFDMPNCFRIVITPPKDVLASAIERIGQFCARYYK
ncbi:hypothetical protein H4219_005393 [Mycoemilia scoparia]|uniref:Tyrosine aminotransferase n=1 Tax=Mycoemilia scoparia TaxID=417184 RepID=A0A9W7ZN46_9FUNG|nr:hypothetical protein H4219_005393 [Mycoemilia scoparia]